jgi:hypothetical protein
MHVLMTETFSVAGSETSAALTAGGHHVHTCQAGPADLSCRALSGDPCPLDIHPVAAVVASSGWTATGPRPTDYGIVCALQRSIPFVLAASSGHNAPHPMAPWATCHVPMASLAEMIEAFGNGPEPELSAVVRDGVREVLGCLGSGNRGARRAGASVYRTGRELRVQVVLGSSVSDDVRQRCAVAVASALRAFEPCSADNHVTVS